MLVASLLAGIVVLAGIVTAAAASSRAPAPSFTSDEPLVTSLLLTTTDVPGATAFGHEVYRPSQVTANPALYPPASVMRAERPCALLEGPTSPGKLTALAVNGFSDQYEMVVEAAAYDGPAPVDADGTALTGPDLLSCVRRLVVQLLQGNGLQGTAVVRRVSLDESLGDVRSVALTAAYSQAAPGVEVGPSNAPIPNLTDSLEFVVLLHARAEVVLIAENDEGAVPQSLIDRVAKRLAGQLDARFPG